MDNRRCPSLKSQYLTTRISLLDRQKNSKKSSRSSSKGKHQCLSHILLLPQTNTLATGSRKSESVVEGALAGRAVSISWCLPAFPSAWFTRYRHSGESGAQNEAAGDTGDTERLGSAVLLT